MTLFWRIEDPDGSLIQIEYNPYYDTWTAVVDESDEGGPVPDLREALAEATHGDSDEPWIVALEDQIRADVVARGL